MLGKLLKELKVCKPRISKDFPKNVNFPPPLAAKPKISALFNQSAYPEVSIGFEGGFEGVPFGVLGPVLTPPLSTRSRSAAQNLVPVHLESDLIDILMMLNLK